MGAIRLSFDDGPGVVSDLLKITETLKSHQIVADFYMNGKEMASDAAKAAMVSVHKAGHRIENHAWTHDPLPPMPLAQVQREIGDTQALITKIVGRAPTRLRPPYGAGAFAKKDPELYKVAKDLNLTITLWHVDTRDWANPKGLASKLDKIMSDVKKSSNRPLTDILMHVLPKTASDLEDLIKRLKSEGYKFG